MGSVYSYGYPYRARLRSGTSSSYGSGSYANSTLDGPMLTKRSGGYVHDWSIGPAGQPVMDMGWTWEETRSQQRHRRIASEAVDHLVQEARAIGAHGVVGIQFGTTSMGKDGIGADVYELSVMGTAVRAPGVEPVKHPFTTHLAATDVAKLVAHGYAPVSFHVGISVVCAQLGATTRRSLRSMDNGEVEQYSEVTEKSLQIARRDLERTSLSAGSVILAATPLVHVNRSMNTTYEATVRIPASRVRRFEHSGVQSGLHYQPIVRLNEQP